MRWLFTAVAAIAGYIMGGFGGMELIGEYAPNFEFFQFKGHIAGLVLGAAIGGVVAGAVIFIALRDL